MHSKLHVSINEHVLRRGQQGGRTWVERRLSSFNESSHSPDNKFQGEPRLREWKKVFLDRHYFNFHPLSTAEKNQEWNYRHFFASNCRHFQLENCFENHRDENQRMENAAGNVNERKRIKLLLKGLSKWLVVAGEPKPDTFSFVNDFSVADFSIRSVIYEFSPKLSFLETEHNEIDSIWHFNVQTRFEGLLALNIESTSRRVQLHSNQILETKWKGGNSRKSLTNCKENVFAIAQRREIESFCSDDCRFCFVLILAHTQLFHITSQWHENRWRFSFLHASANDSEPEREQMKRQEIPSGFIRARNRPKAVMRQQTSQVRENFVLCIISLQASEQSTTMWVKMRKTSRMR